MSDRNQNVSVIAHFRSTDDYVNSDVYNYKLIEKTEFIDMPLNRFLRVLKGIGLFLRLLFTHPVVALRAVNIVKYGKEALSLKLLFACVPFLNNNFDIVHCHFGQNGNYASAIREILKSRYKIVVTFHGYDIRFGISRGSKVYQPMIEHADSVHSISDYNTKWLKQFGIPENRIIRHPVGVCVNSKTKSYLKNKDSEIQVLTVARLVEDKGLEFYIDSINFLKRKQYFENIRFRIIGEGPLREKLIKLISRHDLTENVLLPGALRHDDIFSYYHSSDIFVLPSKNEALPVVIMEAQAEGLPVIATDVGSVKELVINGETGILVSYNDSSALCGALDLLINDGEKRRLFGEAGKKLITSQHDVEKLNNLLLHRYQNLLSE